MSPTELDVPAAVTPLLARSALFRFLSLAFQVPRPERAAGMRALADTLPPDLAGAAREVATRAGEDIEPAYHRILGPGGPAGACETDIIPFSGGKGPVLADIAGFYRAFRFDPSREVAESPDHIAIELSFVAYLGLKEAYAVLRGAEEEAAIVREAASRFLEDHLGRWAAPLAERIEGAGAPRFFVGVGELLVRACHTEDTEKK